MIFFYKKVYWIKSYLYYRTRIKFTTKAAVILYKALHKMKFSIKAFFSKCVQICRKLRIWSNLLKKSLMEIFIFCAVKSPQRNSPNSSLAFRICSSLSFMLRMTSKKLNQKQSNWRKNKQKKTPKRNICNDLIIWRPIWKTLNFAKYLKNKENY